MHMNRSKEDVRRAIGRLHEELANLLVRLPSATCFTIEDQAESAEAYIDFAKAVFSATADLNVTVCEIAADVADQKLSEADRRSIRDLQSIEDALTDAVLWIEQVRDPDDRASSRADTKHQMMMERL